MVISFEEKDRSRIEAKGMMIIEFKHSMYRLAKSINDAGCALINFANSLCTIVIDKILEAIDNITLWFEELRETYHYPVSIRYKLVKVLSKCTGIEKRSIWKMMRPLWLARSCC